MASVLERDLIIRLLADKPDPLIVDLGAYIGDELDWFGAAFPAMRYIAVEADPRNAAAFRRRHPTARLIEGAVAAETGSITFYQCDNAIGEGIGSGSIRTPKKHLEFFPWCKFEKTTTVQGYSLDAIYKGFLCPPTNEPTIDLLWVDLQGAERDMIAGGKWTLLHTRFMMVEAEEHEFYEGQAVRPELLSMLPGWEVVQEFEWNLLLKRKQ